MMKPDILNKHRDDKGTYVDVTVTLKLKGYDLRFCKQKSNFKPDTIYTPFFWKRKEDDLDDQDMSKAKGKGPQRLQGTSSSQVTSMDVDGSRVAPASGGSGVGVQHQPLPVASAAVLGRPTAAPARGRPNMLGQTRSVAALATGPTAPLHGPSAALPAIDRPCKVEHNPLAGEQETGPF
jgi:hypothetical protein